MHKTVFDRTNLWKHLMNVGNLRPYLPHLVPTLNLVFAHLLDRGFDVLSDPLDVAPLFFNGILHCRGFSLDLLQKSFGSVELSSQSISVGFVCSHTRRLEVG